MARFSGLPKAPGGRCDIFECVSGAGKLGPAPDLIIPLDAVPELQAEDANQDNILAATALHSEGPQGLSGLRG